MVTKSTASEYYYNNTAHNIDCLTRLGYAPCTTKELILASASPYIHIGRVYHRQIYVSDVLGNHKLIPNILTKPQTRRK